MRWTGKPWLACPRLAMSTMGPKTQPPLRLESRRRVCFLWTDALDRQALACLSTIGLHDWPRKARAMMTSKVNVRLSNSVSKHQRTSHRPCGLSAQVTSGGVSRDSAKLSAIAPEWGGFQRRDSRKRLNLARKSRARESEGSKIEPPKKLRSTGRYAYKSEHICP